jgi:serine/threonine protein kinase
MVSPPQGTAASSLTPPFVLGQYQVVAKIGQGGMGAVYRALHPLLKKEVAVKILPPAATADVRAVARFRREMEAIGRLDHHHIVRATDAGEDGGVHFLVMELVDGIDLSRLVRLLGPLPVADACELIRQAAVGLQCAHEHGLVHRDVKPSNLVLSRKGEVKVLDLGLALLSRAEPGSPELTVSGPAMGTADYMAPEQWEASHDVDIRADVYSLGCSLYTLLVGRPPFGGGEYATPLRKMAAHARAPVPPAAVHRDDVAAPLEALLARMAAKAPADRPATPAEVAIALEPFSLGADLTALAARALALGSPGQPAPPDRPTLPESGRCVTPSPEVALPPTPSAVRPASVRSKHRAIGVATAAVLLAAALAAPLWLWHRRGGETPPESGKATAHDPGRWQNLLANKPGERLWPAAINSRLDYDHDHELLWFQTSSVALIPLGTADAGGYKLQVGFRQQRWTGGVGVYFGGRPGAKPDTFEFQAIDLRPLRANDDRAFTLNRTLGLIRPGPDGKPQVPTQAIASWGLSRPPDSSEQLLEIFVRPGGLASVRWNGEPCPDLVSDTATRSAKDASDSGEFGIYCFVSSGTVSTARFQKTE